MARERVREWFVYLIECKDCTLYTGIAKDVARRLEQHNSGRGARYTRGRGPVLLRASKGPMTRSVALRVEAAVKRAPRVKKLDALIALAQKDGCRPRRAGRSSPA